MSYCADFGHYDGKCVNCSAVEVVRTRTCAAKEKLHERAPEISTHSYRNGMKNYYGFRPLNLTITL